MILVALSLGLAHGKQIRIIMCTLRRRRAPVQSALCFILESVSSHHDCHRARFNELTEEFIHLLGGEGVVVVDPPGHQGDK